MGGSHASASTVNQAYSTKISNTTTITDTTNIQKTDNSKVANALAECMGPGATKIFNDSVVQYNITTQNVIVSGTGNRVTGNTLNINNIFGAAEAKSIDTCMIKQDPNFGETDGDITAAVTGGNAGGSSSKQASESGQSGSAGASAASGMFAGSGAASGAKNGSGGDSYTIIIIAIVIVYFVSSQSLDQNCLNPMHLLNQLQQMFKNESNTVQILLVVAGVFILTQILDIDLF